MELHEVVIVKPGEEYALQVTFDDGTAGTVDVAALVSFSRVFAPLRDPAFFRQVFVHPEFSVVCWPNGADLNSDVLYSIATGAPLPEAQTVR